MGILLLASLAALAAPAPEDAIQVPRDARNLTEALRRAAPGSTIWLAPGTYSPATTAEEFPLRLDGRAIAIRGSGPAHTILDAEESSGLLVFAGADQSTWTDLTLRGGRADEGGGAVLVTNGSPRFERVVFYGNDGEGGGDAARIERGAPAFVDCLFTRHVTGPTLAFVGGVARLEFVTIARNAGAALRLDADAALELVTSIVASPGEPRGAARGLEVESPDARFRLEDVLWSCWDGSLYFAVEASAAQRDAFERARGQDGLREGDPRFRDPQRGDYRLEKSSPAGEDHWSSAIGAPESVASPAIDRALPRDDAESDGGWAMLRSSAPNPLTLYTTIEFEVLNDGIVDLGVYNVLGQRVRTLHAGELGPGTHAREWDGRDDQRLEVPPGIYFVRVTQGEITESQRLVVVR